MTSASRHGPIPTDEYPLPHGLIRSARNGYVDIGAVLARVEELEEIGWSPERIAKTAGLAESTIKAAQTRGATEMRLVNAMAVMAIPVEPFLFRSEQHGTSAAYLYRGCRCLECRTQRAADQHAYRSTTNRRHRRTEAEPWRRVIATLIERGLTRSQITAGTGLSPAFLRRLLAGQYSILRQHTIRKIDGYLRSDPLGLERHGKILCEVCSRPLADHRITERCYQYSQPTEARPRPS